MKQLLLLCLCTFTFIACGNGNDALRNSIMSINKDCPVVCEHWTIDSLGISKNGEVVYFCNSTNNADYMILLKSKKDSVRNAMIDNINNKQFGNSTKLIKLCKKHNAGLVYKFYSNITNETIVIKIPVDKLISDPADS